jgi:hypothetical protein
VQTRYRFGRNFCRPRWRIPKLIPAADIKALARYLARLR